jgi:uncharacterized protein (TIGR04255 family)
MDPYQEIKYENDPLVEAVCEFRFLPGDPWDLAIPGLVYSKIEGTFPKRKTRRILKGTTRVEKDSITQQEEVVELAQFLRLDETAFIQVGQNILSINHLKPYPTWEEFSALIQDAFQVYIAVAKPRGIQRIGLRYINRIEVAGPESGVDANFNFRPYVGDGLPHTMSSFAVAIEAPFNDDRDMVRVQLATLPTDVEGPLVVLLDIDYYLNKPEAISLDEVTVWIRNAHFQVQAAFENSVTENLRQQFGLEKE